MKKINFITFFTLPFTKFFTLHEVSDLGNKILYVYLDENNHPLVEILNKEKEENEKD